VLPIVIALLVLAILGAGSWLLLRAWSRPPATPAAESEEREPAPEPRHARRQEIEELGTELIQRRMALDARRGPLGGNTDLDEALGRLEDRFRAGEISEQEFEREKVRLLGG
jgi:predicted Zn-dependent peptidase